MNNLANEIRRVSTAARENTAKRHELMGSTITITSLGKQGGIVTTPVINLPEVTIIGVNKAVERPVVVDGQVVIRRMMNLSSSFDHRRLSSSSIFLSEGINVVVTKATPPIHRTTPTT